MPGFPTANHASRSWSDRVHVLRAVPPFLRMAYDSHPPYAIAIGFVRLARALLPVALLWVGKLIIETIEGHYHTGEPLDWSYLGGLILLELGIAVGSDVAARASSLLESLLGDVFTNKTSIRLMRHAARLDLAQFEDPSTYDRLERARSHTVSRVATFVRLLDTAQALITLVSLLTALLVYVPWLLLLLALSVTPAFFGETHFAGLGYSLRVRWTPERRKLEYLRLVAASDKTVKEVKLFGLSHFLVDWYSRLAWQFYEATRRLSTKHAIVAIALTAVGTVGYYGAYTVIVYLTVIEYRSPAGVFTIGVLTFLAASFRQSRSLIQQILLALAGIYEQCLYIRDLLFFFSIEPKLASPLEARRAPRPIKRGFEFDGVGFRYPGSADWALRDVSFSVGPAQSVALVGENGAGKTTVVKLLARLYDPDEGRILLDGVDLREYDVDHLRRSIAVIFQDFVRYSFLLRENIGVGEVEHVDDHERIRAAAKRGLANVVASRLERGFEQQLGREFDEGVELSGGEWQRVALARAYMREAQVLILDEPTAALDARAEYEVFRRVTALAREKIALIISHRFSTVRAANRILVLRNGRLVEQGAHSELVANGGEYAELFNLQAAGYR